MQGDVGKRKPAKRKEGEDWVQLLAVKWNLARKEWSAGERTSREWQKPARPHGPNRHRGTPAHP